MLERQWKMVQVLEPLSPHVEDLHGVSGSLFSGWAHLQLLQPITEKTRKISLFPSLLPSLCHWLPNKQTKEVIFNCFLRKQINKEKKRERERVMNIWRKEETETGVWGLAGGKSGTDHLGRGPSGSQMPVQKRAPTGSRCGCLFEDMWGMMERACCLYEG